MRKKTTEYFEKEVKALVGDEYKIIGEYKGSREKIEVYHKYCNFTYMVTPCNFLRGRRCPKCSANLRGKVLKKDIMTAKKEIYDLNSDYELLTMDFKGYHSIVEIKHTFCGKVQKVRYSNFIAKKGYCKYCSKITRIKTIKEINTKVHEVADGYYSILTKEFSGMTEKIEFRHNVCGYNFYMTANKFINQGNRCPKCRRIKGEEKIKEILEKYEFSFIQQWKVTHSKNLVFDFAILNPEKGLTLVIEYKGQENYSSKSSDFNKLKSRYCEDNNIDLINITYKEKENMETYLIKKLKEAQVLCKS